uniref:Chitin-binding type-4 domain-containing protein n=1 Tax=Globisporangium ultimum (strain ATCC 200006 / CBS 805.95 / DAOM BR144) TaxID=431595 RepID=K3W976_GLOUD
MVGRTFSSGLLVAVAFGVASVNAHGFLAIPAPFFKTGVDITSYTSTIMGDATYPGFAFNTAPSINMENFVKNFKNDAKHPNLRALVEKEAKVVATGADAQCGWTDPSKTSYTLTNSTITYGRNFEGTGEGFVHPGPCETWCDDVMVQQDMHCDETYNKPNKAAVIPIDVAKCKGAKQLTTYWIAMHGNEWQVYLDCVGLTGSASGGSSTSKTPKPTTKAPAVASPAPATTAPVDADADDETPAPATTVPVDSDADDETPTPADDEYADETPAPTTVTPAATSATTPTPTKKKCNAKSRKLSGIRKHEDPHI